MSQVSAAVRRELPSARILSITPDEYHRDPCATPSLSASTAHVMVAESPAHARCRHPRFATTEEIEASDEDSRARATGTLVHRLLLGKGSELAVIDARDFRTNYAKAARDAAIGGGRLPVLAGRLLELFDVVETLRDRCRALGLEFTGESEVPIEWYEQGAAGPVVCRSLIDHLFMREGQIIDVKTISSANPKQISRYFVEHGYDIQEAAYTRAAEQLAGEQFTGRFDFTFLFCELEPPYAVVPVCTDGALREIGRQRWGRAVRLWERCLAQNDWPSYTDKLVTIEAPAYVINEHVASGILGREWAER